MASAGASLLKRPAPIQSSTDVFTRDKGQPSTARKAGFTTKMRFDTNTTQKELQTGGSGWTVAGPDSGLRLSAQLSEAKTRNFPFLDRNFEAAASRTNLLCFRGSGRFFSACGLSKAGNRDFVPPAESWRSGLRSRATPDGPQLMAHSHLLAPRSSHVGKKNNLTKRELIHLIKITPKKQIQQIKFCLRY